MEIPFVGGAYLGRSSNINAQVCQNFYVEVDKQGGKTPAALVPTPGMLLWCETGTVAEVRGLRSWKDYLYAVVGSKLYKINKAGTATDIGNLRTDEGKVWIEGGTTHLCLTDGRYGYYRTESATALEMITDENFPNPSSLSYQDGFFIVTEAGTDAFFISSVENASEWDGLDFSSAEDTPDDALAAFSYHRELWVFGVETTEVFYNSGDASFPFSRVAGGVFGVGVASADSIVAGHEGFFLLDNKFQVRLIAGYEGRVISTPQVEYHIQSYADKSDAVGYSYTQEGHAFYVLTFPSANKTWVFDAITGLWHTRSSDMTEGRHRSNCAEWFDGKTLVGDWNNGNIYQLDLNTFKDGTNAIIRKRAAQSIHKDRKRAFHSRFEIEFEAGTGLITGQGSDPQAMLQWSDDGGHTWGNEHWTTIGKIGEYKNRAVWRRLGSSRERIYRVSLSDPVKAVIIGAHLEAELENA